MLSLASNMHAVQIHAMRSSCEEKNRAGLAYACWENARLRYVALAFALLKLYLVAGQPIFAITPAKMDEGLSVRLAESILNGQWLGAYDVDTLVKGAAYSVFLAGTVIVGIPAPLAQHILYIAGAWLLVRSIRRWLPNDFVALALFTLVLWNPVSWELGTLGRVLRHNLVTPLAMFVFAASIALRSRVAAPARVRVAWACLLGLSLGTLWLTREEAFWVFPSLVMLVSAAFLGARAEGLSWQRVAWPLALAAGVAVAPVATVATLNLRYYGWFGTTEMRAPEFLGAFGALSRITPPDGPIPLVPFNRSVRQMAYEVSPTFRQLRDQLEEGSPGRGASGVSSMFTGIPPERMEFAAGWAHFALRDAVQLTGNAPDARRALDFYAAMAREINEACDSGRIPAGPKRTTFRPVWQPTYTAKALHEAGPFFTAFALGRWNNFNPPDSIGDGPGLRRFRDIMQWHASRVPDQPDTNMTQMLRWGRLRVTVLRWIGKDLMRVGACVLGLGLVAWFTTVGMCVWQRRWPGYLWWATTAAWGGALAIVLIALFMHVTSFPVSNPGYFSAAYPLAYFAAGGSLALLPLLRRSAIRTH